MAKYSLQLTKHYLRDLKLARKRGMDESLLNEVIGKLLDGKPLPKKNHDHQLQTSQGVCPPVIQAPRTFDFAGCSHDIDSLMQKVADGRTRERLLGIQHPQMLTFDTKDSLAEFLIAQ